MVPGRTGRTSRSPVGSPRNSILRSSLQHCDGGRASGSSTRTIVEGKAPVGQTWVPIVCLAALIGATVVISTLAR